MAQSKKAKSTAAKTAVARDERWLHFYRQMLKIRLFEEEVNQLYLGAKMPGLAHLYIGEEAVAVGVCEALAPRRLHHQHTSRPWPLHRQRRGAGQNVCRAARQRSRLLPRQRRLHAYRRSRHRQSRRQCHRRRQRRHGNRRGHVCANARQRSSSSLFFWRRRLGAGTALRSHEHGFTLEAAGHLCLREQPIQRIHALQRNHGGRG